MSNYSDHFTNELTSYIMHHMQCIMQCIAPNRHLYAQVVINFLTSEHSCNRNDASYSISQPSMHMVKYLEYLIYDDNFSFRSRYDELVQILFIPKSINYCEPRSKAIIDSPILQRIGVHYM